MSDNSLKLKSDHERRIRRCVVVSALLATGVLGAHKEGLSQPLTLKAPVVVAEVVDGRANWQSIGVPGAHVDSQEPAFRIASITKTYVAATVLRLVETGMLALEDRISECVSPEIDALLVKDNYRTDVITLKQVLSHTSGLNDHAQSPNFIQVWQQKPSTHWSRQQHIEALTAWTEAVGVPGEKYAYSDSGYLLLGDIIERSTGKPLAQAVRSLLDLDALGLESTWWEQVEPARASRAHQVFEGKDTYNWSPSLDLYGGGGLVAPPSDVAKFFNALLTGKVFDKASTLTLMMSSEGLPDDSPYRLGMLVYTFNGRTFYGHGGFWGTLVVHDQATGSTFAAAAYDRADYPKLKDLAQQYFDSGGLDELGLAVSVSRRDDQSLNPAAPK